MPMQLPTCAWTLATNQMYATNPVRHTPLQLPTCAFTRAMDWRMVSTWSRRVASRVARACKSTNVA